MIETSIIIPVRNQKKSLLMTLKTLKRQIRNLKIFEVIICDDGSTDGTEEEVKKLRYPIFLKYFRNDPPLGRAVNRNLGYERSSGQNLIFLDGDMVPTEGYIEAMLTATSTDIVKLGNVKHPPAEQTGRLEKYLYSRGRFGSRYKNTPLPGRLFTSNNFFISKRNFTRVGGFDPNFKSWGGEDIDFGLRLEDLEIPIRIEPAALTYHYHKRTVESLMKDFYSFGKNSFEYLIKKHPAFLEQLPAHFLGLKNAHLIYKLISKLTVNKTALGIVSKTVSSFEKFNWPDFIFDYLFWGNLVLGYRKSEKSIG
ncbi:MAG: hypothetical protein B6D58_02340 [candidate division Zixibacteria bacterium 4484_95]|nr:MAG: hypothetical protein B6D58_02340 [candidate division Zixibacteria bacterium 4484_95]